VALSLDNSKKELKDFDSKTDEEKKQIKGIYIASLSSNLLQPD
jgi:hypothetical protein